MTESIDIEMPPRGIGSDLAEELAAHGLRAVAVDEGEAVTLRVSFVDDEQERLIAMATHAIEAYLSDRMLPLVVQRGNGGVVVRPPAD
jgi:hypothetical protein